MYLDGLLGLGDFHTGMLAKLGDEFIGVVGIDGFPAQTSPQLLEALGQVPVACRWSTRFIFLDAVEARGRCKGTGGGGSKKSGAFGISWRTGRRRVAPAAGRLPLVARHGEVRVSHGRVRDGVGAAELVAYLQADATSYLDPDGDGGADVPLIPGGLVLRFGPAPPTVRVAEGTAAELTDETIRVVQTINAALPDDWQLAIGAEPAPAGASGPPDGEIVVEFARQEDWTASDMPPVEEQIGLAVPRFGIVPTGDPAAPWSIRIVAGRVLVDPVRTGGTMRSGVIAHEIIHLLGRSHVDPVRFPGTIMAAGGGGEEVSPHVLRPLDREALLAVYGRLGLGTTPSSIAEELGPWSDTSVHVHGALGIPGGDVEFGAALRNGAAEPWAFGPAPHANPEDNAELAGSVTWSGRLIGLTPHAEAVAGAAALTVELPTLTGTMDSPAWSTGRRARPRAPSGPEPRGATAISATSSRCAATRSIAPAAMREP